MIIGPAERLQLEIYTESGWARSCYSYQTEISNSWYAKCPAMKSSLFSRNVAWFLQVKHTLAREIPLLIWSIHSVFFNFRFETNMATPYNALQNTRKSRNDFFFVHSAHLTLAWNIVEKKKDQTTEKTRLLFKISQLSLDRNNNYFPQSYV